VNAQRKRLKSLVQTCGKRAWGVAWSLLRDAEEANDAVQQAFLVAARKADRIPHDDPWPWFAVVVAHEARNLRRKRRPLAGTALEMDAMISRHPTTGDPALQSAARDEGQRLQSAMDRLPPEERDAIALTHLAGMTHATAAEALSVPRQTVSARVQRGLDGLGLSLGQRPAHVAGAVALLPITPPTAGWEAAHASWSQTAV
jgi:RNA polymerase sigma factor (sigma-70 family)